MESCREIDRERFVPVVDRKVLDCGGMSNNRVVYHDVDRSNGVESTCAHLGDPARRPEIGPAVQRPNLMATLEIGANARDLVRVGEAIENDMAAGLCESPRRSETETLNGARDQCAFAFESPGPAESG